MLFKIFVIMYIKLKYKERSKWDSFLENIGYPDISCYIVITKKELREYIS